MGRWLSMDQALQDLDDVREDRFLGRHVRSPYTAVEGNPFGTPKPCPVSGCPEVRIHDSDMVRHLRAAHGIETRAEARRLNQAAARLEELVHEASRKSRKSGKSGKSGKSRGAAPQEEQAG